MQRFVGNALLQSETLSQSETILFETILFVRKRQMANATQATLAHLERFRGWMEGALLVCTCM